MKKRVILSKVLLAVIIFLTVSCSSTQVISSWSSSNPPAGAMKKVLVVTIMANREASDQIEQAMSKTLNSDGINSNSSMSVFGPNGFKGLQENDILSKLKGSDYSSVMLITLVNKEKQTEYVPGTYYAYPYPSGYSRFYRRYWYAYDQVYTPGYYTTSTNYVLQADIYTIDSDELIYSTQTRSYDPDNAKDLATSFAKSITAELRTKKIIP